MKESFIAYDFLLCFDAGFTVHKHAHTRTHTHMHSTHEYTYIQMHTQIGNFGNKYYRHF